MPTKQIRTCLECQKEFELSEENFQKAGRGFSKVCRRCQEAEAEVEQDQQQPEVEPETKACVFCGETITRRSGDENITWLSRKYCYDTACAVKAERKRESARKRAKRKEFSANKPWDRDAAEEIAKESTERALKLLTALSSDIKPGTLDQVRAVAEHVGVECLRISSGAV